MSDLKENPHFLAFAANTVYQAGRNLQAFQLYQRAAEFALQQNELALHVHCLRWCGNSLMWTGRHEEATAYLLQAISFDGDPNARVEDIYTAMTDLCRLSVVSRPYAQFQKVLADTRDFLGRHGLERWEHRLDMLQAMAHLRRGQFSEAYGLGNKAWQGMQAAQDGPRYQNCAYLNQIFRAAHGLGDAHAMDEALVLFQRWSEPHINTSRVRHQVCRGIRLAFDGIHDENRDDIRGLAREALGVMSVVDWVREEAVDALRLLAQARETQAARDILQRMALGDGADISLMRLDIALCEAAAERGWELPFHVKDFATTELPAPLCLHSPDSRDQILQLFAETERHCQIEDSRLECSIYARTLAIRRKWLNPAPTGPVCPQLELCTTQT